MIRRWGQQVRGAVDKAQEVKRRYDEQKSRCPCCQATALRQTIVLVESHSGRRVADSGLGHAMRGLLLLVAGLFFLAYGLDVLISPMTAIGLTEPVSQVRMLEASVSGLIGLAVAGYGWLLWRRRRIETEARTEYTCRRCGYRWI